MKDRVQRIFTDAGIEINGEHPWDIQVLDDRFWRRIALGGSMAFGETYMDGFWDCAAIDELIHRLLSNNHSLARDSFWNRIRGTIAAQLVNLQGLSRAFQIGERHYDIGNSLYRHMLGESMVYSCAYWENGARTLEAAQQDKLEYICRKIDLKPGMRVLDIGCGWGSFCRYAAEHYDVHVDGLTVSREQVAVARETCAGLPVDIHLMDYRKFDGRFDRIVSIGMFEHVGPRNYRTYMDMARRCLSSPDGLFLLHTIGSNITYRNPRSWMTRYIFPNGHIPSIAQLGSSLERRFVVEDLHSIGVNYDHTLMEWESRFCRAWPEILRSSDAYDDRFYRMWRYYLLSCAGSFRARHTQVWQWVLAPEGLIGGYRRPSF